MSAPRLPSPADLPHRLREHLTDLRTRYRQWREELRADPALLWRTPLVRAALLLLLGLVLVLAVGWLAAALAPAPEGGEASAGRQRAVVRVACTNPACIRSYSKELPLDFKAWPLACPDCKQPLVYRAQFCRACRTWFASPPDAAAGCPVCAMRTAAPPVRAPASQPVDPDDAEDDW